jgi:uncharacterized phage protein (TIGR02220 family)
MRDPGFVVIRRRKADEPLFGLPANYVGLWTYLTLTANWTARDWLVEGQKIRIDRGEIVTSLPRLAEATGISLGTVRRALKALADIGELTILPARRWTHVRLLNYSEEQELSTPPRHDSGIESGTDSGIESGIESEIDSGIESGIESGTDNGTDRGTKSTRQRDRSWYPTKPGNQGNQVTREPEGEPRARVRTRELAVPGFPAAGDAVPEGDAAAAAAADVVGYLNTAAGRSLRPAPYVVLVRTALAAGYTTRDLKLVVWWAASEWKGSAKMRVQLDPSTLFPLEKRDAGARAFPQYFDLAREKYEREVGPYSSRLEPSPAPVAGGEPSDGGAAADHSRDQNQDDEGVAYDA